MAIDYNKMSKIVDGVAEPKKSAVKVKRVVDSKKSVVAKKQGEKKAPKTAEERKAIKDSLVKRTALKRIQMIKDSESYKRNKKRIKDALEDTESTEEAIEAGVGALAEGVPAEQAIAAVIETLGEAIDILQEQCPECAEGDVPEVEEGADDEKVEDSLNVTVTNGSGESVEVSTEGGDSVVSTPDVPTISGPLAEEPVIGEETAEEEIPSEGIGDSVDEEIGAEQDALTGPNGKIMELIKAGKFREAQKLLNENEERLNGLGK